MLLRAVYTVEDVLSRLLIALIALIVFVQVISRYFFSKAITWSEELATIAMVWAVYLGAAIAMRKRFHIRILVLVRLMPRSIALATVIIGDVLFLFFCALMLWFASAYLSLCGIAQVVLTGIGGQSVLSAFHSFLSPTPWILLHSITALCGLVAVWF